jgi:hypothetical protein
VSGVGAELDSGGGKYHIAAQREKFAELLSRMESGVVVGLMSGLRGKIVRLESSWTSRTGGDILRNVKTFKVCAGEWLRSIQELALFIQHNAHLPFSDNAGCNSLHFRD